MCQFTSNALTLPFYSSEKLKTFYFMLRTLAMDLWLREKTCLGRKAQKLHAHKHWNYDSIAGLYFLWSEKVVWNWLREWNVHLLLYTILCLFTGWCICRLTDWLTALCLNVVTCVLWLTAECSEWHPVFFVPLNQYIVETTNWAYNTHNHMHIKKQESKLFSAWNGWKCCCNLKTTRRRNK